MTVTPFFKVSLFHSAFSFTLNYLLDGALIGWNRNATYIRIKVGLAISRGFRCEILSLLLTARNGGSRNDSFLKGSTFPLSL